MSEDAEDDSEGGPEILSPIYIGKPPIRRSEKLDRLTAIRRP